MKYFIISMRGDFGGVCYQLQEEGNEVWWWIKEAYSRKSLDGLVPMVKSVEEGIRKQPDVIVFDQTGMGKLADQLRAQGQKVFGAGEIQDRMESDRKFSHKLMESFGIGTPTSYDFPNFTEGMKFAVTHKKRLVMKPSGSKNPELTFHGKTNDELVAYMVHVKKDLHIDGPVTMQEFVEGTEVSTEIWYTNGVPIFPPNATFETKKFMHGNCGQTTGSETSVVWWYPEEYPKIVRQSLQKLEEFLRTAQYQGPIDINGIIRNGRFYGLEFTPRFGYNALYALLRTFDEDLGAVLYRVANGDSTPPKLKLGYGYSLRVSIPPYPFKPDDDRISHALYAKMKGLLVGGIEKKAWGRTVYPLDVYGTKNGIFTAGIDGVLLETTGYSEFSSYEAEKEAVDLFEKIEVPNKQARLGDGARIAEERMQQLRDMDYEVPPFSVKETKTVPRIQGVLFESAPLPGGGNSVSIKIEEKKDEIKPTDLPAHAHMQDSTGQYPGRPGER